MVEWKKLGDIGTFENIGVDKKIVEGEPEVTLLNYVDVYKNKRINKDIPTMKVTAPQKKLQACNVLMGDIFVTPTSETKDDIGHTAVAVESLDNTVYSYHIMRYRLFQQNMTTSHYINYIFDSISVQDQIYKLASGLTRFGLSKDKFSSIIIPIPSLSEQTRIIGILDTFTASIANLKEQIGERRKQYEHYRDQLLDLEGKEGVEMKKISDICSIIKGEYITKKDTIPGIIPVILGGQDPAYYINVSNHEGKAIVISRSGASAGFVSFWDEPIFVTDGFLIEPKNETLKIEYLYCSLKNKQQILQSLKRGAGVPHITTNHINDLQLLIPSLPEQSRIVNILDQFEASIANLEAQLQEREKQYEHYRNQLLTFE